MCTHCSIPARNEMTAYAHGIKSLEKAQKKCDLGIDKRAPQWYNKCRSIENAIEYAPLAQLDRAFGYGPEGRGFESLRAR